MQNDQFSDLAPTQKWKLPHNFITTSIQCLIPFLNNCIVKTLSFVASAVVQYKQGLTLSIIRHVLSSKLQAYGCANAMA